MIKRILLVLLISVLAIQAQELSERGKLKKYITHTLFNYLDQDGDLPPSVEDFKAYHGMSQNHEIVADADMYVECVCSRYHTQTVGMVSINSAMGYNEDAYDMPIWFVTASWKQATTRQSIIFTQLWKQQVKNNIGEPSKVKQTPDGTVVYEYHISPRYYFIIAFEEHMNQVGYIMYRL